MRKIISITSGGLVAAVLTHGLVSSGLNLSGAERLPLWTYRGFFSHAIDAIWRLWNQAHGWASTSILNSSGNHGLSQIESQHLDDFGRFLAIASLLIFPLIGFCLSFSSGHRIGWQWLRPLGIVTVLAFWDVLVPVYFYDLRHVTTREVFHMAGWSEPFAESGRAVLVMLLMLWSIGVVRIRRSPAPQPVQDTAAA